MGNECYHRLQIRQLLKIILKKKKKSCQIQIKILSSHVSLSISILHYLFFLVILSHHEREKLAAALKT